VIFKLTRAVAHPIDDGTLQLVGSML